MRFIDGFRDWWQRPVSAMWGWGLIGVAALVLIIFAVFMLAPTSTTPGQLSDGDAEPVVCMDDGSMMLNGSVGGLEGVWMVPGQCIQTGQQTPVCADFIPYGEAEESVCILAVMPDGTQVRPTYSEVS